MAIGLVRRPAGELLHFSEDELPWVRWRLGGLDVRGFSSLALAMILGLKFSWRDIAYRAVEALVGSTSPPILRWRARRVRSDRQGPWRWIIWLCRGPLTARGCYRLRLRPETSVVETGPGPSLFEEVYPGRLRLGPKAVCRPNFDGA